MFLLILFFQSSYSIGTWKRMLEIMHSLQVFDRKRCVKSVQIRSFFWSVFSRIWTEYVEYFVNLGIQSKYGKIRTRKTPYLDIFLAVKGLLYTVIPTHPPLKAIITRLPKQLPFPPNLCIFIYLFCFIESNWWKNPKRTWNESVAITKATYLCDIQAGNQHHSDVLLSLFIQEKGKNPWGGRKTFVR